MFVNISVTDLHLALDLPQVYIAHAKGENDGYVPILPALAQELQTHLAGRRMGYLELRRALRTFVRQGLQHFWHSLPGRKGRKAPVPGT